MSRSSTRTGRLLSSKSQTDMFAPLPTATKLALHYMRKRNIKGAIVLMGSLSSFFGIPLVGRLLSLS